MDTTGTLALVGGDEWTDGCTFDAALLAASGGDRRGGAADGRRLPAPRAGGAAGGRVVRAARAPRSRGSWWWTGPRPRTRAWRPRWPGARFIYLAGGSPLHLRAGPQEVGRLRRPARRPGRRRRRGRGRRRGDGADRPHGRPAGRRAHARPRAWSTSSPSSPTSATSTTTPTARSSSARWPWPRRRCRSSASPARTALIRDGDGAWRSEGVGDAGGLRRRPADRGPGGAARLRRRWTGSRRRSLSPSPRW